QFFQIPAQPIEIGIMPPCERDFVRHPRSLECCQGEGTHLDWMIDEFIVVAGFVGPESMWRRCVTPHSRGELPFAVPRADRPEDINLARLVLSAEHPEEYAGSVE